MSLLPQPLDQAPPNIYLLYPKWKGGEPSLVGEENRTKEIRITFRSRSTYITLSLSLSLLSLALLLTPSLFPLSCSHPLFLSSLCSHPLALSFLSLAHTLSLSLSLSASVMHIISLSYSFSISCSPFSLYQSSQCDQIWRNFATLAQFLKSRAIF